MIDRHDCYREGDRPSAGKEDMFQSPTSKHAGRDVPEISVFWFVSLFAAVTYVALSTRAILNPYEIKEFLDLKRIISVVAGTWMLSAAISAAKAAQWRGPRAQVIAVLQMCIPGVVGIFMVREIYDLAVLGNLAQRLDLNIRWMLSFVGYFAAAVATFFALSYYRQLQAITASAASADNAIATSGNALDRQEIANLLTMLRLQTGYETADFDVGSEASARQERRIQIDGLLARLGESKAT